jgi:hypothetical protein
MTKFKVGDLVKVKSRFDLNYYSIGKVYKVNECGNTYLIEILNWVKNGIIHDCESELKKCDEDEIELNS